MANIFNNKNPYQTNKSYPTTQPKTAAATTVKNKNYPNNAFNLGLSLDPSTGLIAGQKYASKSPVVNTNGQNQKQSYSDWLAETANTNKGTVTPKKTTTTPTPFVAAPTYNISASPTTATQTTNTPQATNIPTTQTATSPTTSSQNSYINNLATTTNPSTYQQVVNNLANFKNPVAEKANQKLLDFQNQYAGKVAGISSAPIGLDFQQGQKQVLANQYSQQLPAYQTAVSNAVNIGGQGLSGLQSAMSGAAPQQVPYSNQYISPLSGQSVLGGATSGLTNSIPSLAQSVANGTMTIDQANSYLGNTTGLTDQLRQAVSAINPNFNFTQSSASATTQAQGQQIQTTATAANSALDKLATDFSKLSSLQTGGIPATNSIANWIAGAFGQGELSAYETTLNDARAQLEGVLTATGATTPSGASAMAMSYLPDNMTSTQFESKIAAAKELINQKVSAFTQSGVQTTGTATTDFNW